MVLGSFGAGLAFGFAMAAPVGPIGLLVVRRTLAYGRRTGLATGMGAATADACYGTVAALGLTALASAVHRHELVLGLVAAVVLVAVGARIAIAPPPERAATEGPRGGLFGAYASTVALTLANPLTILTFAAAFTGLAGDLGGGAAAVWLVVGVATGSGAWWVVLTLLVGLAGRRAGPRALAWVNRASGAGIALLGGVAAWRVLG